MRPRHAVLLAPSKPSRLFRPSCGAEHTFFPYLVTSLLPCSSSLSSLDATFMFLPASVASKGFTAELNPLDATFTKNRGWGVPPLDVLTPIPANVSNAFPRYPLCFHTLVALTGSTALEQLFSNQPVTHSFRRDGGGVPLPSSLSFPTPSLDRNVSVEDLSPAARNRSSTSHESPVTGHASPCPQRDSRLHPPSCILSPGYPPLSSSVGTPAVLEVVMNKTLKIVLIVAGVLVVLVLVALFLIPVNQFRPTIEEKASAALGRKVEVGNLSLSLFSGSLAADNLAIADDPKFSKSPFLTAKSIKVGVELMPLILHKDLNITRIVIDSPEVTLLRGPGGEWNYSSFGASAAKSQGKPAPPSSQEFSVAKLELRNGRIIIGSTNSQKRSTYDKVDLTASNVSLTSKFPVTLTANLPGGGDLKLDGTAGPLDQENTALTPVNAKLAVNNLNLATTGILDPSAGLGGLLDLNATLASQNGEANVSGNAKLSRALLIAGGSPAAIPVVVDFKTKYDLRKNRGVLEPSTLKIGNAVARLSGTYEVPADSEGVILHVKVEGQSMPARDLETFLPALGIQ